MISGAVDGKTFMPVMEINMDLLFWVLIGVVSYHYGKKKGHAEGTKEAHRESRVWDLEERLYKVENPDSK